jgi:hypothetical protein
VEALERSLLNRELLASHVVTTFPLSSQNVS